MPKARSVFSRQGGFPSAVVFVSIALLAILSYSNTFNAAFLFDDYDYIIGNNKNFMIESYWPPHGTRYFTYLSFALNYMAGGMDVRGYHAVNLAIHIANGSLVYILARQLMKSPRLSTSALPAFHIAALAALLFTAHPVQTEAVTYISQRFASLATLFYLSAVVLYLKWRLSEQGAARSVFYALSLVCVYAAQMTKEFSFTLPFVILSIEFAFFSGPQVRRLTNLIPFLFAMAVIPFMLFGPDIGHGVGSSVRSAQLRDLQIFSAHDYLMTQFRVIVTYLRLLALPIGQNLEHDYPLYRSILHPAVLVSFLFLLSLFIGAVCLFARFLRGGSGYLALIATGVLWFFTTISVESSIVPIKDVIFEHRLYLPGAGAAIAASAVIFLLFGLSKSPRAVRNGFAASIATLVLPLALATYERNKVWQNGVTLYEDAVAKSPEKERVRYNLAWSYHLSGDIDKAVAAYYDDLRLDPDKQKAHYNLGKIFMDRREYGRAKRHFGEAARIDPTDAYAYYNLASLYLFENDIDNAIKFYTKSVEAMPQYENANYNLALVLARKGDYEGAEYYLRTVLALNPSNADAIINLGRVYASKGERAKAREAFGMAIQARPELADLMAAEIRRLEQAE